jgi:hypothetical protein
MALSWFIEDNKIKGGPNKKGNWFTIQVTFG